MFVAENKKMPCLRSFQFKTSVTKRIGCNKKGFSEFIEVNYKLILFRKQGINKMGM